MESLSGEVFASPLITPLRSQGQARLYFVLEVTLLPKVGPKGQVVISKSIRERLGVEPGWLAHEVLVDDHVEIRFFPPEHMRSLRGLLKSETGMTVPEEEWAEAKERAWHEYVTERWSPPPA